MALLLTALAILVGSGMLALATSRASRWSTWLGAGGAVVGGILGLVPATAVLAGGATEVVRLPWDVPYGSFHVELDALSAFFAFTILGICILAAIYGSQYMQAYEGKKPLGPSWFFFDVLMASMVLVVIARNAVLFLVAWEVMALASFFLVTFEDEKESVRNAGWTYLVATHLGTAFLLALFIFMGQKSRSMDFDDFSNAGEPVAFTSLLFLLALVGFGTKAGFMPFHVWLPEAHPAAPSHVSAVMSGVMIKTGIYGLVRVISYLGEPPAWWGWLLIGIGLVSGVLGVLFALAQHDLKRLLAYHSVENIGIIGLGLGVGLLGQSYHNIPGMPLVAALGFSGALLHVLNHAVFKSLLFLGAGAVLHETGTVDIDHLGGLAKRMPWTAGTFLTGAVAISGLPPLNGFASEFLIYLAAFRAQTGLDFLSAVPTLGVIAGLALIGGLAAACFTKAFGIVFLGSPRSAHVERLATTRRGALPPLCMLLPMLVLAAGCFAIGIGAPVVVNGLGPVVQNIVPAGASSTLDEAARPLVYIVVGSAIFFGLVAGLTFLRSRLLSGRPVEESDTWGCGFAAPTVRMQYTASSYAQPLVDLFRQFLWTKKTEPRIEEYFPQEKKLATETPDLCRERFYAPVFLAVSGLVGRLRWLQHGRLQLYVLYIALTMFLLLIWYLGMTG